MALFGTTQGHHFSEPWKMWTGIGVATSLEVKDAADASQDSTTTAFFTEMARRGAQETTNWTANTYKTILSVSSGKGYVAAYVGCTAGGSETHTVEFTVDGILSTITITGMASGDRAVIAANPPINASNNELSVNTEALASDKATFTGVSGTAATFPGWSIVVNKGIPLLAFTGSLLIRAKHSATITNSTATAYSAVMYKLGLAS